MTAAEYVPPPWLSNLLRQVCFLSPLLHRPEAEDKVHEAAASSISAVRVDELWGRSCCDFGCSFGPTRPTETIDKPLRQVLFPLYFVRLSGSAKIGLDGTQVGKLARDVRHASWALN